MRRVLLPAIPVLAAAALWGALGRPPAAVAPVIWLAALWLPGAALAGGISVPGARAGDDLRLPFAFGPVLFGIGVTLGRLVGLSLDVAALGTILLGAAALAARLARGRRASAGPEPAPADPATTAPETRRRWFPLIAGVVILALGMLPSLVHEPLRMRDDARLHLPIIQEVLAGHFPPGNPFLAGQPLAYFWFYHVTLAGVVRLTHLPLDLVPALFNLQALALLLYALDRAGKRFGLSPIARGSALLFLGLGLTPWGWVRLAYLKAFHPELNWAMFRAGGVSTLLPLLSPHEPRLAASLTKVAMTNALPMSLALAALAVTPPRDARVLTWIRRGCLVAGVLGFHLATGLLLVTGLGTAWLAARLFPVKAGERSTAGHWGYLAALAIGTAVAVPYFLSVEGARQGSTGALGLHLGHGLRLHLAILALWLFTAPVIVTWLRAAPTRTWLAAGLPSLVLPFAAHLVDGNEYKGIFFLLPILSLSAGAGLARVARERTWMPVVVFVLFFPTAGLAGRGYAVDVAPGTLAPRDEAVTERIGAVLPPNAVIWRPDLDRYYSSFTIPLAHPNYLSDVYALQILGQWNGDEARWRRGSLRLLSDPARTAEALAAARSRVPGHPLEVLVTTQADRDFPHLRPALDRLGLRRVAATPLFTLHEIPAGS